MADREEDEVLETTGIRIGKRFKLKRTDTTGKELVDEIWKYYETRMIREAYQIVNDTHYSPEERALAKKFLDGLAPSSPARTFNVPIDDAGHTYPVLSLNPNGLLQYCAIFNNDNYPADYEGDKLGEYLYASTFKNGFYIDVSDIPFSVASMKRALDSCEEALSMVDQAIPNCYNFMVGKNELNLTETKALLGLKEACRRKYRLPLTEEQDGEEVVTNDVDVFVGDLAYHTVRAPEQVFYELDQVIEANVEADTLIDELKHHIAFDGMSPFEAYLMVYDFVTQKAYRHDEESIDERSYVGTLSTDARVCAGYALLLTKMCNKLELGDLLKVEMVDGRNVNPGVEGHGFCKVTIDDSKYKIKGVYAADPTADAVLSPRNDEERKIMGHVLTFSKKASEECDDEEGKRLAGSKVLNALIPPQVMLDYGIGRNFKPNSPAYETYNNSNLTGRKYPMGGDRFPASAPVVSLQAYRDGLKRGFMYRFNGTHTTRQINSMVEEKMTNSRLAAWASGVCFGKEYNRWYNRVNLFRPEKYKMGVANTSLARATKHYARKFRLDKVHNVLRSVLVTIVEGAVGLLSNIRGGIAARRARRSGSTPTPTPTPTP